MFKKFIILAIINIGLISQFSVAMNEEEAGASLKTNEFDEQLLDAAMHNDEHTVEQLLYQGANPNASNEYGMTPLMYAVMGNNLKNVELLLEADANINQLDNDGWTALKVATINGFSDLAENLRQRGAVVDKAVTPEQQLIEAARKGDEQKVVELLDSGVDINSTNKDGQTALIKAANMEKPKIVDLLIKRGANINQQDKRGETALWHAALNWHPLSTIVLVRNKADATIKNALGQNLEDEVDDMQDKWYRGDSSAMHTIRLHIEKALGQEIRMGDHPELFGICRGYLNKFYNKLKNEYGLSYPEFRFIGPLSR